MSWDMVALRRTADGRVQLHFGRIAEMGTGEGKTLVGDAPAYLNALPGVAAISSRSTPIWPSVTRSGMGHLYRYLGMTVAVSTGPNRDGRPARGIPVCITYGTRTSSGSTTSATTWWCRSSNGCSARPWYAIFDEVDSVLIDEARTPLIISGPVGNDNEGRLRA